MLFRSTVTPDGEKGRGLPEITKLRSTATGYWSTYREGVAADSLSKNILLVIERADE